MAADFDRLIAARTAVSRCLLGRRRVGEVRAPGSGAVLGTIRGVGAGYESQPRGSRIELSAVRGYFVDLTSKTTAATARTPETLPPAGLAQLALGWWERSLSGDPHAVSRFDQISTFLAGLGSPANDGIRWPYMLAVPKYGLEAPWYSAMAQGQAASVFVRAFLLSDDEHWGSLAFEAIRPLLVDHESDVVAFLPGGPVLQEVPGEPRAHVLNGWIYALWGLWDVHIGLGEALAGSRFRESANLLASMLDLYDVGWWTRYSLFPHRLTDLAKPFYHRLHATQMEVMASLTGRSEFESAARRWADYDNRRHRVRALAQKAVFRVARSSFLP
jgi:heparosan-N-sulfate-glucuronate 5-epimerase